MGIPEMARSLRSTVRKPSLPIELERPDTEEVSTPGRCTRIAKSPAITESPRARSTSGRRRRMSASTSSAPSAAASMSVAAA